MEKQNTNLILISMVAVVAIVGIIIMVTSAGTSNLQYGTDSAGQAARALKVTDGSSTDAVVATQCGETDGPPQYKDGMNPAVKGTTTAGRTSNTDFCRNYNSSTLVEYYCSKNKVVSKDINCADTGLNCVDGACQAPAALICGDEIITPPYETCDGTNWGNITGCVDLNPELYIGGTLSCYPPQSQNECSFDTRQCITTPTAICGDGIRQPEFGEECDGSDWGNITSCSDFGYAGGQLSCDNTCHFDLSQCMTSASCYDTDGGINYAVRGTVYGNSGSGTFNMTDFCSSAYHLTEYFCTGNYVNQTDWSCQCGNGSCIPQLGNLYVTTVPTGASLYLGNVYKGLTPITLSGLNAGYYTVKLVKTGYNNYTSGVNIVSGQTTTLSVNLSVANSSQTGSWYVTSNPSAASVYVDNVYKGVTPLTINGLTVGNHEYRLTKTGYYNYTGGQIVNAGQTTYINITLVSMPKPDLYAEDILFIDAYGTVLNSTISTGTSFYIVPRVKNLANVAVYATQFYNRITFANNTNTNSTYVRCSNYNIIINPGASFDCDSDYIYRRTTVGANPVSIGVDYYNTVLETNENNNARTEIIYGN